MAKVGDEYQYRLEVTDPSRVDAFVNQFTLRIKGELQGGGEVEEVGTADRKPTTVLGTAVVLRCCSFPISAKSQKMNGLRRASLNFPPCKFVVQEKPTPIRADVYDFYVNVDNKFLKIIEKESSDEPKLVKAKFIYGLVLIGLALLQDSRSVTSVNSDTAERADNPEAPNIEAVVDVTTRAIAPILLPMLESIGALDIDDDD